MDGLSRPSINLTFTSRLDTHFAVLSSISYTHCLASLTHHYTFDVSHFPCITLSYHTYFTFSSVQYHTPAASPRSSTITLSMYHTFYPSHFLRINILHSLQYNIILPLPPRFAHQSSHFRCSTLSMCHTFL